ncbi:dicarboxylate transporter/tellurite-resistance protein TehA [Pseudoduganella ginsengisoli]|uniref:C4-dicarboxylate ABC transporter n=1 Tax=Pseudoduganella ginsengisoli TaxID=1462440 RepID=A0A6L6Q4U4_9BURK|nr:SLAC1 anion channel family protein [Pseudoduganella ginsengisoli]MTW04152.1 C4-dicarboxylate ABC transporter [Pseudoduganella ginsengisoli]
METTPRTAGQSVRHLPVNLFASVMGIAGLALAWRLAEPAYGASPAIGQITGAAAVVVFIALAAAYSTKLIRFPDAVRHEFRHPVAGNFFGTIGIGLLLLSAVLGAWNSTLQQAVWLIGVAATLSLGFIMAARLLGGGGGHAAAVPAWLIPGVAALDIVVTGATMPMAWAHDINVLAAAIGSVMAVVLFVMIFARLVQHEPLPAGMTPSLMVMIAPFEVGFLAYLNLRHEVDLFAALLFWFGLFLFAVLSVRVFRPSVPFGPAWWGISFPLAALANAALKYADATGSPLLAWLAAALLAFLTVAIGVLAVRTVHSLVKGQLLVQ